MNAVPNFIEHSQRPVRCVSDTQEEYIYVINLPFGQNIPLSAHTETFKAF